MNKKKKILVFVDWFVPGTNAGGPIRSVYSMVKLLAGQYDFSIFTRNTDHGSSDPYKNIEPDQWIRFEPGIEVYYCSAARLDAACVEKILDEVKYDRVYINSFYSKWFSIVPLQLLRKKKQLEKVVLAPRGMLGKGALQVKPLKKKLFIAYARFTGMHRGITWQASSESEKKDIQKVFGEKAKIKVAGNLSYIKQLPRALRNKQEGELNLFFLSRIVPIKNLHTALEALKQVSGLNVVYDIYGPAEDQVYMEKCRVLTENLPGNIHVRFKGSVPAEDIQKVLQEYDVLLMPTLNENFGHAILESFCAGCPVIISDQTPWNNLEKDGVGYNVTVFKQGTAAEIAGIVSRLAAMDKKTFDQMSVNAYDYGTKYQSSSANIERAVALFG